MKKWFKRKTNRYPGKVKKITKCTKKEEVNSMYIVLLISFLLDGCMIFYLRGRIVEILSGQVGLDQLIGYLGPIGLMIFFSCVLTAIGRGIKEEWNIDNENVEAFKFIDKIAIFLAIVPLVCVLTGDVIAYALGFINDAKFVALAMIVYIVLVIADILYDLRDFFLWRHTRTKKIRHDDNEDQVSGKNDAL